ncbi:MAG TPA: serine protease [Bacteriovoracaceae bacterium]|nr:serine protease [Bacteriovoracaceae bacterium]
MNLSKIIILILLSLALQSCGKKRSSERQKMPISPQEILFLLENQTLDCDTVSGTRCPEGIAKVFVINPVNRNDSHLCTGFMNGSNRLVTNNHCVANEAECSNTFFSIYDGTGSQTARCKRIISTGNDEKPLENRAVDYTVLELDRSLPDLERLEIADSEPEIGETLTAWVMDHFEGGLRSRITELDCKALNRIDSLELGNCQAIQGNSGSPLLNSSNEVVGVIWGASLDESVKAEFPLEQRRARNENAYATEVKFFKTSLITE